MKSISLKAIEEAALQRPAGYLEEVLSYVSARDGDRVLLRSEDYYRLKDKYSPDPDRPRNGPGAWMHRILLCFGIQFRSGCKCKARIIVMNQWGCDGCIERIDEICGWLREEATTRRLPYADFAGRMLVKAAVFMARREAAREKTQPQV